ncbi:MAG TPA: hypothetical protein VGF56_02900 [Rhizomicrobium sp.]
MSYAAAPGKPGYETDAALVTAELANFPKALGDSIIASGIGIVACRSNVTDYAPQLHNVQPRNWPAGSTWDIVPGAYIPELHKVVIATQPTPGGGWHVPVYGELEGSRSIVIHESMHAYDYEDLDNKKSAAPAFLTARQADFALLGAYFQYPNGGAEETFAESAAMRFGRDQSTANAWPALAQYWAAYAAGHPPPVVAAAIVAAAAAQAALPRGDNIGHAVLHDSGVLSLNLVAQGANGEIGHARLTYAPNHPDYQAMARHVTGGAQTAPGSFVVKPF